VKDAKSFCRRQFLRGAGGAALLLPFLPSLLPREARAQATVIPKRFVALWTSNGTVKKNWYPIADPTNLIAPDVRAKPLASISGNISTIMGPEISAFKSKMLLLRGLDGQNGDGHQHGENLAGSPPPVASEKGSLLVSIDQKLAASSKVYQSEPKTRVLSICGTDRTGNFSFIKSGNEVVPAPYYFDMKVLFDNLFAGMATTPDEAARLKVKNGTLVDGVLQDYNQAMASRGISSSDRIRLESHVTHIHELQKRINDSTFTSGCAAPPGALAYPPRGRGLIMSATPEDIEPYLTNMMDMIVAALRCDLTRIVTWLPLDHNYYLRFIPTMYDTIHALSHGGNDLTDGPLTEVQIWLVKKFAQLLKKLDGVVEADGSTLLDNTAVLWRQEFEGNGLFNHKKTDLPVILAGGTKFLNSGRLVDYRRYGIKKKEYNSTWMGVPYNQVLVTILHAFGLTPAEYENPGSPGYGSYFGGTGEIYYEMTDAKKRTPLFSLLKS
jgi:hypothetical protein